MSGASRWDSAVSDPQLAESDLLYWLHDIDDINGNSRLHSLKHILVLGDASSVGYAAFTPNAERPCATIISFVYAEIAQISANELFSVFRETRDVNLAWESIVNILPA